MTKAQDIMTTKLVVARPHESLHEIAERMNREKVSGLPVVDAEWNLYGIVTEADIMRHLYPFPNDQKSAKGVTRGEEQNRGVIRWFLESADYESSSEAYKKVKSTPVSQVMSKVLYTASPADGVGKVVHMMMEKQVNRIPIVKSGKIVGIIARSDIVRMAAGNGVKRGALAPADGYR